MKMTRRNFLSASALTLLSCQLAPAARADCLLSDLFHGADTALPPKPLTAKVMDANPFMGRSESNIHHDCYNTDSTDAILPVGICPEVNVAMEKTNPNASPAIFFDNFDNPVSPFLGGLAIRDLDAEEVRTIGFFSPAKHDGGGYLIQSSYSFVDGRNLIVCPTSHNHVLMLRATDENGTPLPVFEKVLDINIKEAAERVLGRSLEQNLLSIVFDYDGNLWFVTGGFRIYPSRGQQGAMGYISHNAIDAILAGGTADLDHEVHVYAPAPGEGAENGIASCREGAVILTNLACYLLRANGGVEVVWRTPYDSVGAKDSREGAATTGGGLAWGGGCSPSLSRELVFFTDNLETVSLMAVDIHTGEVAASHPVIDELPANMPVSVENSAIVYDHGNGRVSTIVCNWFGAGSPNLAKPDSDSSIQSYENIYDRNWLLKGNCMIMPGVERVDTIRTADGWTMKSIWCRDDLSDTSMMKLSTATGYIYGFVQDVDSGMWQYIVLDFDTGKTVLTVDVASLYGYNNMRYNPFAYIHEEKDILKLVTTLMTNTKGEGQGGDPFWDKAERLLLTSLIAYLHYEAPAEEQNFATLLEMLNTMQVSEEDEDYQNPVDLLFEDLAKKKPNSFAGRQYKLYKLAAGVVCFKRLIHHDMSKSLKTYKATKQKGDPHEQTENNRPV